MRYPVSRNKSFAERLIHEITHVHAHARVQYFTQILMALGG